MAGMLTLELVTPERVAMQTKADFVVLPALRGEMGVLPGHLPFLVQLNAGEVRVTAAGATESFAVSGGFAEIQRDRVSIFAETAEMAGEIDTERARQALERARAQVSRRDIDPLGLQQAERAIRAAQVRLRVAELKVRRGQKGPHGGRPE